MYRQKISNKIWWLPLWLRGLTKIIFPFQQLELEKKLEEEERRKLQKVEKEKELARTREEYIRSMGRTGRTGLINGNYVNMIEEQMQKISQKDLRYQEKVLRDHCLVMGRVNDKFMAWFLARSIKEDNGFNLFEQLLWNFLYHLQ